MASVQGTCGIRKRLLKTTNLVHQNRVRPPAWCRNYPKRRKMQGLSRVWRYGAGSIPLLWFVRIWQAVTFRETL